MGNVTGFSSPTWTKIFFCTIIEISNISVKFWIVWPNGYLARTVFYRGHVLWNNFKQKKNQILCVNLSTIYSLGCIRKRKKTLRLSNWQKTLQSNEGIVPFAPNIQNLRSSNQYSDSFPHRFQMNFIFFLICWVSGT